MTPSALSSLQNPRVRYARKLSRRAFRDQERAFILEGPVVVTEAFRSCAPVRQVFLDVSSEHASAIRSLADASGTPVVVVGDHVMRSLSGTATPQGVLAICAMTDVELSDLPERLSLVLVLAGVQDPGNAGTLVRSAVAAGADAVVFSSTSVDPFSAKTVRSSAGLIARTAVVRQAPLEDVRSALKDRGVTVLGADAGAESSLDEVDLTESVAFVLGNEAGGLSAATDESMFDELVKIPMPGPAESLNVASAGTLLLFEAVRQRRLMSSDD